MLGLKIETEDMIYPQHRMNTSVLYCSKLSFFINQINMSVCFWVCCVSKDDALTVYDKM